LPGLLPSPAETETTKWTCTNPLDLPRASAIERLQRFSTADTTHGVRIAHSGNPGPDRTSGRLRPRAGAGPDRNPAGLVESDQRVWHVALHLGLGCGRANSGSSYRGLVQPVLAVPSMHDAATRVPLTSRMELSRRELRLVRSEEVRAVHQPPSRKVGQVRERFRWNAVGVTALDVPIGGDDVPIRLRCVAGIVKLAWEKGRRAPSGVPRRRSGRSVYRGPVRRSSVDPPDRLPFRFGGNWRLRFRLLAPPARSRKRRVFDPAS
jgi:hypothetical protein